MSSGQGTNAIFPMNTNIWNRLKRVVSRNEEKMRRYLVKDEDPELSEPFDRDRNL